MGSVKFIIMLKNFIDPMILVFSTFGFTLLYCSLGTFNAQKLIDDDPHAMHSTGAIKIQDFGPGHDSSDDDAMERIPHGRGNFNGIWRGRLGSLITENIIELEDYDFFWSELVDKSHLYMDKAETLPDYISRLLFLSRDHLALILSRNSKPATEDQKRSRQKHVKMMLLEIAFKGDCRCVLYKKNLFISNKGLGTADFNEMWSGLRPDCDDLPCELIPGSEEDFENVIVHRIHIRPFVVRPLFALVGMLAEGRHMVPLATSLHRAGELEMVLECSNASSNIAGITRVNSVVPFMFMDEIEGNIAALLQELSECSLGLMNAKLRLKNARNDHTNSENRFEIARMECMDAENEVEKDIEGTQTKDLTQTRDFTDDAELQELRNEKIRLAKEKRRLMNEEMECMEMARKLEDKEETAVYNANRRIKVVSQKLKTEEARLACAKLIKKRIRFLDIVFINRMATHDIFLQFIRKVDLEEAKITLGWETSSKWGELLEIVKRARITELNLTEDVCNAEEKDLDRLIDANFQSINFGDITSVKMKRFIKKLQLSKKALALMRIQEQDFSLEVARAIREMPIETLIIEFDTSSAYFNEYSTEHEMHGSSRYDSDREEHSNYCRSRYNSDREEHSNYCNPDREERSGSPESNGPCRKALNNVVGKRRMRFLETVLESESIVSFVVMMKEGAMQNKVLLSDLMEKASTSRKRKMTVVDHQRMQLLSKTF